MTHRNQFSASRAGRLIACPGSADLEASIPGWIAPVVDHMAGAKGKGTIIHELMANAMQFAPSDLDAMATALEFMADLRRKRKFKVLIEQEITAEWLVSKPTTTADVVLYVKDELHIIDYKTGKIPVPVWNNEQLLFYALTYAPLAPDADGVWLHIVQPWIAPDSATDGIDSWWVDLPTLAKFKQDATEAELKILQGSTVLHPSDHCTFCPANPHSRSEKGSPLCPPMLDLLYPPLMDLDEIMKEI